MRLINAIPATIVDGTDLSEWFSARDKILAFRFAFFRATMGFTKGAVGEATRTDADTAAVALGRSGEGSSEQHEGDADIDGACGRRHGGKVEAI